MIGWKFFDIRILYVKKRKNSDNHSGREQKQLAGVWTERELLNEQDFIECMKKSEVNVFSLNTAYLLVGPGMMKNN